MTPDSLMILATAIPLGGAVLIGLSGQWPNLREAITLTTALALFACVAALVPDILAGARPKLEIVTIMPGLLLSFALEPLGMLFAIVASFLWIMNSIYSVGYMRGIRESNQTRFYVYFAVALSSTMGVALSGNLLTLFIFYELLTLSTYPLVTHKGTDEAIRGGRTYLGLLLTTSIGFFLLAILWTWNLTGTLEFTPGGILAGHVNDTMAGLLLFLYVFGIGKAALMPLHRWLPAAMVAPTPVSALLHAVAVVKAGVFAVMKVAVYIFGIDFLHHTGTSEWLMYVAGVTMLTASLVALAKDNLKARLAYSTVSQLAYIVLGAALANGAGVLGGSMHIAMHAFGKITLFFCAGAIYVATGKTEISDMKGIGRTMPITMFLFFIGALSVIGLPPTGGSWSKWYLMLAAADANQFIFVAVLIISSMLNIAYLVPIVARAFFVTSDKTRITTRINEAPALCVIPVFLTACGCIMLFFYSDFIYQLLIPITQP